MRVLILAILETNAMIAKISTQKIYFVIILLDILGVSQKFAKINAG